VQFTYDFNIKYVYDFITKLYTASKMHTNYENEKVGGNGHGGAKHRKYSDHWTRRSLTESITIIRQDGA